MINLQKIKSGTSTDQVILERVNKPDYAIEDHKLSQISTHANGKEGADRYITLCIGVFLLLLVVLMIAASFV